VDAFRDTQTYETANSPADLMEIRRGGSVTISSWTRGALRWEVGAGLDSWRSAGRTASLIASADQRLAADRVSLRSSLNLFTGSFNEWTWSGAVDWRSSVRHEGNVAVARAGFERASTGAPLALWPGAGTGPGRPVLLRAHALLDDGVVTSDIFGRRLYHAGAEWRRWFKPGLRLLPVAPAIFVDVARAERRLHAGSSWHADAGAGIRFAVPGSGVLRVDVAKGLRDGATAFSVGWTR
jgi:hypothetical protein